MFKKTTVWAAALVCIFAAQALWHAVDKSATWDEMGHLASSYLTLKTGHTDYDIGHPNLIRHFYGLSLLLLNPPLAPQMALPMVPHFAPLSQRPTPDLYRYADYLIYFSRIPAEKILIRPRIANILVGCMLGIVIFIWSKRLYGLTGGFLSLSLFAFCPNLIAHGSLVTTDVGGIAFAMLFLCVLDWMIEVKKSGAPDSFKPEAWGGVTLGLALLAKYTNVFLVPLFIILYPVSIAGWRVWQKRILKSIAAVFITAWFVICASYQFANVLVPHTLEPSDWEKLKAGPFVQSVYRVLPLPDTFLRGLALVISHNKDGHGAFFMGRYSSDGWLAYFPAAILLKTPTVTLFCFAALIFLLLRRRISVSRRELLILLPFAFVLGSAMQARVNIGIRHILLCYPLLYVFAGSLMKNASFENVRTRTIFLVGFLLLGGEVLSVSPNYLAFFNRVSGGPGKGIDYLSDSNIDWGQDLKNLGKFLKKEGNPEVVLSYFGTASPEYYGITYQSLPSYGNFMPSAHVNSVNPARELLAVSVTSLQGPYFIKHDLYGWLLKKEPVKKIGYSIYIYDITNDVESQKKLLEIYQMTGDLPKITRQVERIKKLESK